MRGDEPPRKMYKEKTVQPEKKKKQWKLKEDPFQKAEQQATKNLMQDMMDTKKKVEEAEKRYVPSQSIRNTATFSFADEPKKEERDERRYNDRDREGDRDFNNNYRRNNNQNYYKEKEYQHSQSAQDSRKNNFSKQNANNTCEKYLRDSVLVEKDSHGLEDKIKKVKKLFKEEVKEALSIKIRQANIYPMIFFEYQKKEEGYPEYMHLRDFLRKLKDVRERQPLFEDIFARLFQKVPNKFYKLAVFGVERAKELKFKGFNKESIFHLEEGCEVMFYFGKGRQGLINFTLVDRSMRIVEFSSPYIRELKKDHPDQYHLLQKFQKIVFDEEKEGEGVDLFNNEQLSSDEDERLNFEEKTISELRNAVYDIIDKDTNDLDELIEHKYDQMVAEGQRDSNSDRFKKLSEEYEDLSQNRDNFVDTRNEVAAKLEKAKEDKAMLKVCLKKLIIAEKQLQSKLPIVTKKRKIFEMLSKQNLLIIEGETGSGKSTQLPQMLCEFYSLFDNHTAKPVLVTQPRKLATRSLAERVAKEMGEDVGGFVDYVASSGRQANSAAKIVFKLDRLVLDQITVDPLLSKYSCLVIDEAHQRTISIDVILGLVKELLKQRKDFKVIVTSASMDIHLFESYFSTKTLKVSGRTYPVSITYKNYEKYREGDKDQIFHKICKVIDEEILHDSSSMKNEFKGHLLCFCSSVDEISKLARIYSEKLNRNVFSVFELHGKVSPGDQRKVFEETGKHKFIFASRIAETAITIDGVRVVIDPGLDIELVYDQKYKVSSMKLQEITQSSAKQRAGRSGRTGPGHCFRLYSEQNFKSRMPNKIPQIKNSSLETVVLRLKSLKINDVLAFAYIEKPDVEGLKRSLDLLKLIGALSPKTQAVTKIGELIVKLPIEPFLSRAIVEALIFEKVLQKGGFTSKNLPQKELILTKQRGVKTTVVQILALIINFSNLFFINKDNREKGEQTKYYEFSDQEGDFFFLDNIYHKYKELRGKEEPTQGKKRFNSALNSWIKQSFLNFKALNQIGQLIGEVEKVIEDFRVTEREYEDEFDMVKTKLRECKSFRQVILSCLISSFSANLCKFSGSQHVGYTIVNQRRPIHIYGTSNLSLLGIKADWIICYDLYTNEENRFFCKVAHKVEFEFMKRHIDKYIWKRFEIEDIEKKNPFYTEIFSQLPTKIVQNIKFDYRKGENDTHFAFLREAFASIAEETNTVSFFLQAPDKGSAKIDPRVQQLKNKLNKYLTGVLETNKRNMRHNYVGNIFITLGNGFEVKLIEFSNKQFCVETVVNSNQLVAVLQEDSKMWGQCFVEDMAERRKDKKKGGKMEKLVISAVKKRVKLFIQEEENKNNYIEYLKLIKAQFPLFEMDFKESLVDKRRKIPQTKILLHFFAGTCEKDNLLISYSTYDLNENEESIAQEMLELIQEALQKKRKRGQQTKLYAKSMHLTRNKNGINVSKCRYDEYEIIEELYELDREGLLTYRFKFPSFVKKFREPEISQAAKTNEDWKDQILDLLEQAKIKTENIAIDVRGYYKHDKKASEYERRLRVDMNVTITTLDSSIFTKLKTAYDGKKKVLGCEKLHVRVIYEQVLAIPSYPTFESLYEEYDQFCIDYRTRYPLMSIESIGIRTRNKEKVLIKARSSNRADFLEPQRCISALFSPRLIKLEYSEFRFLDRMDSGNAILNKLEEKYDFKIYFGMSKINNALKVYCEEHQLKPIEDQLKAEIKKFKFYCESISYRGKNLNKVKQLLQAQQKNLRKQEMLEFEIQFQQRKVQLTADLTTFERIKNEILKLSNSEKGECDICADIMRNPYKLIECGCTFCWLCLADHIRNFRNSPNEELLKCPKEGCKSISMQDAKTLLTEEEFEKICDIKISKHIERNPNQYMSCKHCEHIFDKKEVEEAGEINCEVCGKCECLKCGDSHPNYTCEEWKNRDNLGKHLSALGVKQCPKCKTGIQKNGGCNHMECKNCHTHICWKCMATFNDSKLCYDHLAKQCGGIFDRDAH